MEKAAALILIAQTVNLAIESKKWNIFAEFDEIAEFNLTVELNILPIFFNLKTVTEWKK